jgi:hypothetical protein
VEHDCDREASIRRRRIHQSSSSLRLIQSTTSALASRLHACRLLPRASPAALAAASGKPYRAREPQAASEPRLHTLPVGIWSCDLEL